MLQESVRNYVSFFFLFFPTFVLAVKNQKLFDVQKNRMNNINVQISFPPLMNIVRSKSFGTKEEKMCDLIVNLYSHRGIVLVVVTLFDMRNRTTQGLVCSLFKRTNEYIHDSMNTPTIFVPSREINEKLTLACRPSGGSCVLCAPTC